MTDHSWIESMQDELNQFERLQVWELIPRPEGKNIIALKWLWKNKCDAENIVVRNKTRLVAKGYRHQPEGFIDLEFPDHVYRLKKALYGLKQAPRAWYDKLYSFLIEHGFTKVHQSPRDIFISQSQYAIELLKKHGIDECISRSTPIVIERLDADLQGTSIDQTTYSRMIGGLMYLTASRPDISYATFVCARYQARPTVKHLKEVKWIFRYLRLSYNIGLWYPKDFGFELIVYLDADHAGCKDDYKSTSGGLQFLGEKLEHVEKGTVELYFVSTEYQLADLFTKAFPKERFEYLVHRIDMRCMTPTQLELIIMAQQQHAADVHPDELCPPNKRYDLMDANKKVDFEQVQCPPESKILMNIIKDHPLRFSIAASSSVPWIYMAQFWHTLKEDGSKYRLTFMLDKKMLSLTLDDFRTIFHLPQATDNNHDSFVPPPSFLDMVPFYKNELGFTMELKTSSSFKTTGLLQPWQTLCKIFSKCLTTRVTGWDQPPLQIMQMMYCFINNIHVDYAELLWEGLYYSLHHPTSSIPYPRFTKIIISHYMTNFPEISRRARDIYHNLKDDDIMKNIFNSGRHKDRVGMKIPDWMISYEMTHTEHYRMYAEVFRIDVPLTQSQPTESSQGTHRTPSTPRRSTRLTPPALVPIVDKADEMILKDTLKNVIDDSPIPRNVDQNISGTWLEPRSDKESLEVEITNVVILVNVNEEEEELTDEVYELKRREKGMIIEESKSTPSPTPIRSPRIHTDLGRYGYLFEHLKAKFLSRKSFDTLADHLQKVMVESLLTMVDKHIMEQVEKQVPEEVKVQVLVYVANGMLLERQQNKEETDKMIAKAMLQERGRLQTKISSQIPQAIDNHIPSLVDVSVRNYMSGHILHVHPAQPQTTSVPEQQYQLTSTVRPRDQDDPHDDAPPEGENSAKRQKTSEYEAYVTGESSGQVKESKQSPSSSGNQEQVDDYDFWTESCTSGDEHQYHINQMKNFLKSDIVWESRKEILASPHPRKTTPLVQRFQRDLEAPALSLINQDLLYLKKGNSGPEKIVLSLHKFPVIIFNDVDTKNRLPDG
ncbi:copia protein [Tanacetum coccineum]|uniref:Copia protein n=1 Tax=Tanacetum coccineum TaxID=301880 RepID=A0ABQ5DN15_9ASTR